jgi:hypothetical protein
MKSIKQQYIDLKEGRMSQQNFMRNLRMTMPQYVTNVTSYGDAVKILKNKGILTENLIQQLEKGIETETKEHGMEEAEAAQIALDHLKEDPEYYSKEDEPSDEEIEAMLDRPEYLKMQDFPDAISENATPDQIQKKYNEMFGRNPQTTFADVAKALGISEDEVNFALMGGGNLREAKSWTNASGKELYAQFKEIDNLNGQEVLIGIDFEIERNHELSKTEAIKLVLKNLKKNPIYYTATLMAGKEMTEIPTIGKLKPGSDKMRFVKGEDSLVDKDNGMKPVKDVAKVKASANKASKETNKPEGTISLMSLVAKASRGVDKMAATGEKMKIVKEARLNLFPNEEPNEVTKQVQTYINSNPDLEKISDKFILQNAARFSSDDNRSVLQYGRSEIMPEPALEKLELQFNVERDAEEHDDRLPTYYYILTPKFKVSDQTGVARFLTKEALMQMIREELEEILTIYGDNMTDVAGRQLDENK